MSAAAMRPVGAAPRRRRGAVRHLRLSRAGQNFLTGCRHLDRQEWLSGVARILQAMAEAAGWLAMRVLAVLASLICLLAGGVAWACRRSAAGSAGNDDCRPLTENETVDLWTLVLRLIPWALGKVSIEHTILAGGLDRRSD